MDTDPFEERQPKVQLLENLAKPLYEKMPHVWNQRDELQNEIRVKSIYIRNNFPDHERLLETAYADFLKFMDNSGVTKGKQFCFRTEKSKGMKVESYRITISDAECLIESSDTEGIRRAIYYIEDEMYRREGTFLPKGEIYRYAVIKTRISRGFLNPHYCPGCDGELADDTEYYPDNYLNRLAHDGVNALWVQERFRVLLPSKIIPEYGRNGRERVKRLNKLVARCKRYGIKIYLEGIEPASTMQNPALKNHQDLLGQQFGEEFTFCCSTEKGREYIRESTKLLFTLVPDLAGIINITVGEAISNCASLAERLTCPNCKQLGLSKAEVLDHCEKEMLAGMREAKPDAELISWAYAMRAWTQEDRKQYFDIRNKDTISMINFEDLGEAVQLGKVRTAMDYWLSYTGPGEIFAEAALSGEKRNAPVFAKIQVCSSHEVSTVPYVPVPGILYDKYKYMHEHQVSGVMYCWYFGNYPSMMSKAAGELAFAPFFRTKKQFLEHIAGIYWGCKAKEAAQAYQMFEEGYSNYPVSMTFEWHGPMGDAPVWPLHLEPVDLPVSRSYKTTNMVGSDRLGETMLMGHNYEEVIILCNTMSKKWSEGTQKLLKIDNHLDASKKEQQSVAQALNILFDSGSNIIKFYFLRNMLGFLKGNPMELLKRMRDIVVREKENSLNLEKLCQQDKRLGYHCEAMGYKFFPEKLIWRVNLLNELLNTEFIAVEKRIKAGDLPLPFYFGKTEGSHRYIMRSKFNKNALWEHFMLKNGKIDLHTKVRVTEEENIICIEIQQSEDGDIIIKPEFEIFHPYVPILLSDENGLCFLDAASYGLFGKNEILEREKWKMKKEKNDQTILWKITLVKKDFFGEKCIPFRLAISRKNKDESMWQLGDRYYDRLIFGHYSPDSFVFIIPERLKEL